MTTQGEIMDLERRFWQSMVDMDIDTAVSLLDAQSVSAGSGGIRHFDPDGYKELARSGDARLASFEFSDEKVVFPTPDVAIASYKAKQSFTVDGQTQGMVAYDTTTWVRKNGKWLAAAHTESPEQKGPSGAT